MSSTSTRPLLAGRYQLDDLIATGGFGEVWRGTDILLARRVAVKLLQPGYSQHPDTMARFRAEARHAGSLSHEGIAHVYDYCEPDPPEASFLVMELVDGSSLAEVLASGPLDAARAMEVVAQVAAGLHAAHQAGLVHRDIKPGNLLLGRDGLVKITDFGISHAAGSAPITGTGMMVGTPAYLAPERIAGARATSASDLYSLGIVAYECLAGAPPYNGTLLEVALAHRDRPMPPLPSSVPADVAALVSQLTAKDPAARPGSAGEVAGWAGRLRARMTSQLNDHAGERAAMTAGSAGPVINDAETPISCPAPARWWPWSGISRPGPAIWRSRGALQFDRRTGLLAAAAAAVAVIGLVLTSVIGNVPQPRAAAVPSSISEPSTSTAKVVDVSGSALIGRPVRAVHRQLEQLGLRVRVLWRPSDRQPQGRVVSLQPSGHVLAGSLVVVTGARRPAASIRSAGQPHRSRGTHSPRGHGKPNGNATPSGKAKGKGKGKGHGQGNGNGNGDGATPNNAR
jgi:serine/threonine protein kinase